MKYIIGILILLLAVLGIVLLQDNDTEEMPNDDQDQVENTDDSDIQLNDEEREEINEEDVTDEDSTPTVVYTNDGFEPETIEVNVGDTVRFVNESDEPMWVGSDPHPSHHIHPDFDQGEATFPGVSFEHTFDEAGSWGYHNHVSAGKTGTVIVE